MAWIRQADMLLTQAIFAMQRSSMRSSIQCNTIPIWICLVVVAAVGLGALAAGPVHPPIFWVRFWAGETVGAAWEVAGLGRADVNMRLRPAICTSSRIAQARAT